MQQSSDFLVPPSFQNFPAPVLGALKKFTGLDILGRLLQQASSSGTHDPRPYSVRLLEAFRIGYNALPDDLNRIPSTGAAIVVANHPFGIVDGVVIDALLREVRQDIKILANSILGSVPESSQNCILVDVFDGGSKNARAVIDAMAWLRKGGLLVVFPAGVVSAWDWKRTSVTDTVWNTLPARLATKTKACVVPIFFNGHNSVPFQLAGMVHPLLRTARLPAEVVNKRGTSVEVRVGTRIPASELAEFSSPEEQTEYLRTRTYLLRYRRNLAQASASSGGQQPVEMNPLPGLAAEIAALPPDSKLAEQGGFTAYIACARQIPGILMEIGRLREIAFRAAGEGTGNAADVDSFDLDYEHLFLWNEERKEVAGAYRLARTSMILQKRGVEGLYTNTLFHFHARFFRELGPAIELGRSFVRLEYQKDFAPLLLLWRAITRYAANHPDHPKLFGAVSISSEYSPASLQLIHEYWTRKSETDPLRRLLRPRRPFRSAALPIGGAAELKSIAALIHSSDTLSNVVKEIEGKGAPVLLRQYAKVGGRILGFHVDKSFGDCLDGLILVDLRETDRPSLARHMGEDRMRAFLNYHGIE
jgi:putative hemolysin